MAGDPTKALGSIKNDLDKLKTHASSSTLDELSDKVDSLLHLFDSAADEMKHEEAEGKVLMHKVDVIESENKTIAQSILALADMINELKSNLEHPHMPRPLVPSKPMAPAHKPIAPSMPKPVLRPMAPSMPRPSAPVPPPIPRSMAPPVHRGPIPRQMAPSMPASFPPKPTLRQAPSFQSRPAAPGFPPSRPLNPPRPSPMPPPRNFPPLPGAQPFPSTSPSPLPGTLPPQFPGTLPPPFPGMPPPPVPKKKGFFARLFGR